MKTKNKEQRTKLRANHFKFLVMFLPLFLTVSCQEDLYNLEKKGTQKIRNISFNELKNRVSQKKLSSKGTVSILDKVASKLLAKSSEEFIQEVDTTKIIEIQKDGFSSFTLNIVTTDQDIRNLYNLVIVERDNEYKEILLKYHFNSTTIITPENFSGTVTAINQDGTETAMDIENYDKMVYVECGNEIQIICECTAGNAHCGGEANCDGGGHVVGIVIQPTYCLVSDGGGDGGISAPSTPSNPASPNNNNSGSNGINTTPNGGSNPATTKVKLVINKLKDPNNPIYSECYASTTQEFKNQVQTFLTNEFTDPNQSATDAAIEAFTKAASDSQCEGGEVDFDNKVILAGSLKNNPCLYGVYTQLGKASGFQYYLKKFDGNFSVANLKLKVGVSPTYPTANAVTSEPQNYLINIMFNPNNLNRPQLDVARTFIHELIHAEIYRKLLSLAGQPNIPWSASFINSIKSDYPGLYDYYLRYMYNVPQGQAPSSAQHQLMAQHYRQIIIDVLQQYDESTQTPDVYNALSWIGLMGTGDYDNTTGLMTNSTSAWQNLSPAERLQIVSIYQNFKNNNPPCQQ